MRKEFLTNLKILLFEFSSIEHPSTRIYGLRFWWIFGLSLSLCLLSWREPEEKKRTLADQYTEYIQDGDDEDTTVGNMSWSSATVITTTVTRGGIVEADEVAELDEEKREEEEILEKQLVEFGESTLTDVVPRIPGLLQDMDDEDTTVQHLLWSSAAVTTTITGGDGIVEANEVAQVDEEKREKGEILNKHLVEFGEYVLTYIPLQDSGFLQDRDDEDTTTVTGGIAEANEVAEVDVLDKQLVEFGESTLADIMPQVAELLQDKDRDDEDMTTVTGGTTKANEVAEVDEEKREKEETLDKQLEEFGESTLADIVPQVPGLLQDKDDEDTTVQHLSWSSAAVTTTVTGGRGDGIVEANEIAQVEEEKREKGEILDKDLVEFGEYVLKYIPLQDSVFLQHRGVPDTTGSATTDNDMTMQLCLRRGHLWGMGTYDMKVRSFVESVLPSDSLLGVWGMRGVGKSELLGLVHDYYCHAGPSSSSYFHHVVLVSAAACTAGLIVSRAQHAIAAAAALGLETSSTATSLDLDEIEAECRATVMLNRLQDKDDQRRILLLLDDVEEPFDLFDLGLPVSSHKIIYATRSQSVCDQMMHSTYNTIEMRCMGQDDAWNLFRQNAGLGIGIDHPQVDRLAKEMVEECRGLPLALRVIGRAMSSKRDVREWRNAYNLLKDKHSMTQEDQGYSYLDILETQLKESFLVTSLWPQDGSIPKEIPASSRPPWEPKSKSKRRRRVRWVMDIVLFCQMTLILAAGVACCLDVDEIEGVYFFSDEFVCTFDHTDPSLHFLLSVQFLLNFLNF